MALALYRKYRPATFAEVAGQEHVTEPLCNALRAGRINHAYLFSGPRGCGKTSSARILARSLNCEQGPTDKPCGTCNSCIALAPNGPGSVDVVELDAASHGGVDDARELRDKAFYAPAESRYRVFIIDEAHMVTTQGFNALLKIVEEPPEHLVFVFATTEPDKVLPTIRSRTHHYPFRLIPPGVMRELLERNCAAEGISVEAAVYPLVIAAGGGSARDTQSVLDQLLAGAGPGGVSYERAVTLLGVTDATLIDDMVDGLSEADGSAVFGAVDRLVEAGHDPRRFASDLLDRLRDLLLLRAVPDAAARGLISAPGDQLTKMAAQAERIGSATLTRYAETVHNGLTEMRGATAPRLLLELLCSRMLLPELFEGESAVLQRLERLERRISLSPAEPKASHLTPETTRPSAPLPTPRPVEQAAETPVQEASPCSEPTPEPVTAKPVSPEITEPEKVLTPGALDATAVRRVWSEVLANVRSASRSVEAMLSSASVHSVQDNEIVLTHTATPLVRRLSESRNTDVLADALHGVLGGDWRVQWRTADSPAEAAHPERPETSPSASPQPPPNPSPEQPPSRPATKVPSTPPPADEELSSPESAEADDEDAMIAEAARPLTPDEQARQRSPEDEAIELLSEHLGARKID